MGQVGEAYHLLGNGKILDFVLHVALNDFGGLVEEWLCQNKEVLTVRGEKRKCHRNAVQCQEKRRCITPVAHSMTNRQSEVGHLRTQQPQATVPW